MKTNFLKIGVLTLLAAFCFSCEKEHESVGYSDFLPTSKEAYAYMIKSLKLEKISMTDPNGEPWNTGLLGGSKPDIYFKIQDRNNSTSYYVSNTKTDVSSSGFPVLWDEVNVILDLGMDYKIVFFDKDDLDSDDIMANCIWDLSSSYSGRSSYTWESETHGVRFTVELSWLYK